MTIETTPTTPTTQTGGRIENKNTNGFNEAVQNACGQLEKYFADNLKNFNVNIKQVENFAQEIKGIPNKSLLEIYMRRKYTT